MLLVVLFWLKFGLGLSYSWHLNPLTITYRMQHSSYIKAHKYMHTTCMDQIQTATKWFIHVIYSCSYPIEVSIQFQINLSSTLQEVVLVNMNCTPDQWPHQLHWLCYTAMLPYFFDDCHHIWWNVYVEHWSMLETKTKYQ